MVLEPYAHLVIRSYDGDLRSVESPTRQVGLHGHHRPADPGVLLAHVDEGAHGSTGLVVAHQLGAAVGEGGHGRLVARPVAHRTEGESSRERAASYFVNHLALGHSPVSKDVLGHVLPDLRGRVVGHLCDGPGHDSANGAVENPLATAVATEHLA